MLFYLHTTRKWGLAIKSFCQPSPYFCSERSNNNTTLDLHRAHQFGELDACNLNGTNGAVQSGGSHDLLEGWIRNVRGLLNPTQSTHESKS